jgi:hypothetical protein
MTGGVGALLLKSRMMNRFKHAFFEGKNFGGSMGSAPSCYPQINNRDKNTRLRNVIIRCCSFLRRHVFAHNALLYTLFKLYKSLKLFVENAEYTIESIRIQRREKMEARSVWAKW